MLIALFLIWLIACSWLAGSILKRIFPVSGPVNNILGGLFSIFILGLTANVFAAWFKLTDAAIISAFCISAITLSFWHLVLRKVPEKYPDQDASAEGSAALPPAVSALFLLSAAAGFYAVFNSPDASGLSSPWLALPLWYLAPIFVCSGLAFYAAFKGGKTWQPLCAIIILSLLVHSYLLAYSQGFGGDRFRHLASEERMLAGLEYQPTLSASNLWIRQIGPLRVPAALIDSAKLSYGMEWSLEVIVSKITGIGVFQINRFLLLVIWSLFLPLLIYAASLLIWPDRRRLALLAAAMSSSFYLLQYYGSQGLPASFGFLGFALAAALWLSWSRTKETRLLLFCLFFSVLSYFNYSLAFILIVIFGTLAESMRFGKIVAWTAAAASAALLFLLDTGLQPRFSFSFDRVYSAWRDGNMLVFQSGSRLAKFIGQGHVIIDILMLAIFTAVACWLLLGLLRKKDERANLIAIFFVTVTAAYLASWIFTAGDHTLSRRLTLFAVLPLALILPYGIDGLANSAKRQVVVSTLLAAFTAYSYFSGPVLDVSLTRSDIDAARLIWPSVSRDPSACVRQPLPVVLALEYVSAKEFQEDVNMINCDK